VKILNRAKLISTLHRIKALADESLRAIGERPEPRPFNKKLAPKKDRQPMQIDFDKPLRPFMKNYAKGLSGPKKFVLLLSRLTRGDLKNEVELKDIQKHWNRMTSKDLLGIKFNLFFSAQARNNDWVESKKKGVYNLRPSWRQALEK